MSQAASPEIAARRAATSRSATDEQLVSDFKHLGVAVRTDETEAPKVEVGGAAIAARAAYARHSVDEGIKRKPLPNTPLQHKSDHDDLRQERPLPPTPLHHKSDHDDLRKENARHESLSDLAGARVDDQSQLPPNRANGISPENLDYREPASEIPSRPDTKDTTVAEPVVHETIRRQHHEIRQEVIDREIHEYHEVTHILPVVETVVLPTKHFIETADGRKVEIPEPKTASTNASTTTHVHTTNTTTPSVGTAL